MSDRDRGRSGSLFPSSQAAPTPQAVDQSIFGFSDTSHYALVQQNGTMEFGAFRLTAVGLEIGDNPTVEDWNRVGVVLHQVDNARQWLLGDWANCGEDQAWGDKYTEIMKETDYDYETLRNYASTARRVPLWIRNPQLTFAHHRLVAPYAEQPDIQRQWLDWALTANNGKPAKISQMRQAIKDWENQNSPPLSSVSEVTGAPKTLISREKPREVRQFLKLAIRAGQGDVKARQRALGQLVQLRQWMDDMEQWLKG